MDVHVHVPVGAPTKVSLLASLRARRGAAGPVYAMQNAVGIPTGPVGYCLVADAHKELLSSWFELFTVCRQTLDGVFTSPSYSSGDRVSAAALLQNPGAGLVHAGARGRVHQRLYFCGAVRARGGRIRPLRCRNWRLPLTCRLRPVPTLARLRRANV